MKRSLALLFVPALAACGVSRSGAPVFASADENIAVANGRSLNGVDLNGRSLNGRSLNGRSLNGTSLSGATLNGAALGPLSISGTLISAGAVSAAALPGARLVGYDTTGAPVSLTFVSAEQSADPDVWLYQVTYLDPSAGQQPLCGTDAAGAPVPATALAGVWNYGAGAPGGGDWSDDGSSFTFACVGFGIAKCVELGYKPWMTFQSVPLRDYHQACTRMLKADYCGDGSSYTVDGTLINIYDGLGIQLDTESWKFEAEWDASGARCLVHPRIANQRPPCDKALSKPDCGELRHFRDGTLLMDEDARR